MVVTTHVRIRAGYKVKYYSAKGYSCSHKNDEIVVSVDDLPVTSFVYVLSRCDECLCEWKQQWIAVCRSRRLTDRHRCNTCNRRHLLSQHGVRSGADSFNWNPNKTAFVAYSNRVASLTNTTYRRHSATINPHNYPRTVCGVPGGWQLDHIVPIRVAFDLGWPPERCARLDNLQMLPWAENRSKWASVPSGCANVL